MSGCAFQDANATLKPVSESNEPPSVFFCPRDGCRDILESAIKSANSSVHCAFYDLNLQNVMDALIRKSASIDVKIVMDNDNDKGQAKGILIKFDDGKQLMHNKFCVMDGSRVITGSFNPTENDNGKNNNNLVMIHSGYLAANYESEFGELWSGRFGGGNRVKHPVIYLGRIRVESYFCPEDCELENFLVRNDMALGRIISLIRNASKSVQVAAFTFTNEKIADELIRAESRGINVTILVEKKQRNVIGSQYQRSKEFGMNIRLDGNKYNMHHKFIIIDGKIVVTGSPNFTLSGFGKNDENELIFFDETIARKYLGEFDVLFDIAGFAEGTNS